MRHISRICPDHSPVRDSQEVLLVVLSSIGVLGVVDDQGAAHAVRVLAHVVRVVPVGSTSVGLFALSSCVH